MRKYVLIVIAIALVACDDDYPPCSPDGDTQIPGGPVHGPTDPGPDPVPGPGPDGAEYAPRYRTNAAGEVCECGVYELGCSDSPAKARGSAQPGAYCPYPRDDGDPVLGGVVINAGRPKPTYPYTEGRCTCYQVSIVCGVRLPPIEYHGIIGDTVEECVERTLYALSRTPSAIGNEYEIECFPNN